MKTLVLALIASLAAGTAFATPRQFDLVCTGTVRSDLSQPPTAGAPWTERVSVDLDMAAYCAQPCQTQQPIARIAPGVIFFDEREALHHSVNRVTGDFFETVPTKGYAEGVCTLAAFTPFPKPMF